MGLKRTFGFHKGDRKVQPKTAAERYHKTPAEIEGLKRQNACFACGQKGHMTQAYKSKSWTEARRYMRLTDSLLLPHLVFLSSFPSLLVTVRFLNPAINSISF
jgi:hypothetical protein